MCLVDDVAAGIKQIDMNDKKSIKIEINDDLVDNEESLIDISQNAIAANIKCEKFSSSYTKIENASNVEDSKKLNDDKSTVRTIKVEKTSALTAEQQLKDSTKDVDDKTLIRRSGRIKTINKSRQREIKSCLQRDKKRTLNVCDEDSSNASFDVLNENATEKEQSALQSFDGAVKIKTEEQLEKERIDREVGLKSFINIIDNEYRSERIISKEAKKMTCDCFLAPSEIERNEMGCGDDCLNRMLLIECGQKCVVGERCTNRRFQKHLNADCTIFKTEKKGYGLIAKSYIPPGVFVMEYVGEVLNSKQFERRANDYSKQMNAHYYFMALSSDCVIDATKKGNISRFINHSCEPNAETQKWTVNGELRIGFFSTKAILPDEEITFDYQFQRYGQVSMHFNNYFYLSHILTQSFSLEI